MKKLLFVSGVTGAYGYRLANKKNKENIIFDIECDALKNEYGNKIGYKSLFVLSKLADVVIFTNGNKYYYGDELDILYNDVDKLSKLPLCDDKYMFNKCVTLTGVKVITSGDVFDPFKMANKTHFVTMRKGDNKITQTLVKLCCMVIVSGFLDDFGNIDVYHG